MGSSNAEVANRRIGMARSARPQDATVPPFQVEDRSTQMPVPDEHHGLDHEARWRWIVVPLLIFVFSRAALLGVAYLGLTFLPELYISSGDSPFRQQFPALDAFCRHDCVFWFSAIAERGYWEARATNFFPLFPFLSGALHQITGLPIRLTMLIVANSAGLGALLVVYRIFLALADPDAAYSFSFFQATDHPESLMMLFGALAILLALKGHHIWAGVALGVGVLARHLTMFAGAGLLAAQIRQRGRHPRQFLLSPALLGLVIPWLFLGGYCFYQYLRFGDPLAFYHARNDPIWARAWWGIDELLTTRERDVEVSVMRSYAVFALIPTIGALALAARRKWAELAAFTISLMLVVWAIGVWGLGRYSAAWWPAFLPLGELLARWPGLRGPVILLFAIFQGLFFYLFTHAFYIL
jgi:hypothetical protein